MLSRLLGFLALGFLSSFAPVTSQSYNQSLDLLTKLFTGYDKDLRPLLNQSLTLNVNMMMDVRAIESVNEKDQTIAARSVIMLFWRDELLTWDPQDYNNLQVINPGLDRAWLPPLNLASQISDNQALVDTSLVTPLRVRYDGSVSWFPNVRLVQTCKMDMTYFPNDEHDCIFEIYMLMYSTDQVLVGLPAPAPDVINFIENGLWSLLSSSWASYTYPVDGDTYQAINVTLTIKRRPQFFLLNLLFPTLALSFLNILVFVLPADSGEKVGYSITVLLSVMLIMGVTTDNMPASSQLPLITQFMAVLVAISVFSVVATVISLFVHHKIEGERKEKTKTLSVLRNWKDKMKRRLHQVYPAQKNIREETGGGKTNHQTEGPRLPPLSPCDTVNNVGLTSPSQAADSPTHTHETESRDKPQTETGTCLANRVLLTSKHPSGLMTPRTDAAPDGLSSLWHRERSRLSTLIPSNGDLEDKKSELECEKGGDFLIEVQVQLDLIFFWLFLVTWIAVTLGFSIAIFT